MLRRVVRDEVEFEGVQAEFYILVLTSKINRGIRKIFIFAVSKKTKTGIGGVDILKRGESLEMVVEMPFTPFRPTVCGRLGSTS
jgi:hypothetical protein